MVSIETVRAHNAKLKSLGPGLVAVFVGGTSGLGETTLREFVRATDSPRVYLVGRNETHASSIISELQKLNPDGKLSFVKSDVSSLRNVDKVSNEIKQNEKQVNLLFLSPGILTTKGRDETPEGLDKKFSLHYYSRMRFTFNLLPLLQQASGSGQLSRVVSVLGAGRENQCELTDLSLKTHYSLGKCAAHAITMTSLAVEQLALANPGTTFIHAYPGIVKTNIGREQSSLMQFATKALFAAATPWTIPVAESGERHLYAATSDFYPPQNANSKDQAETGSDGKRGSGAYLLSWDGTPTGKEKVLKEYREKGIGKDMWNHTLDVFEKICNSPEGMY